jgi:hypothetical protein
MLLRIRPGVWERPSRHASALERSALRLRVVQTEVLVEEKDMKDVDGFLELRELESERGDTIGAKKLEAVDGEAGTAGGAERGGRCDVGEAPPTDLAGEDDEAKGKCEELGMRMGGGIGCGSSRLEGTLGRAEDGAGLGDGRVRIESREGRRAGESESEGLSTGRCRVDDGKGCCLVGARSKKKKKYIEEQINSHGKVYRVRTSGDDMCVER